MSQFSVLAVVELSDMDLQSEEARTRLPSAVTGALDQMMAPYDANAKEGDHLVFQEDKRLEEDYAECVVNCVKTPDGRILSASDSAFSRRFLIWEGKIFQKSAGQLHHLKRTQKAKKYTALPAYPVRKFYRTLQAFAEDYLGCVYNEQEGKYGYYRNPNAKWDWFQIGGRWPYAFLVKEGCWSVIPSELSWACQNEEARKAPEGYRWVSGARKTDIQWEMMKIACRICLYRPATFCPAIIRPGRAAPGDAPLGVSASRHIFNFSCRLHLAGNDVTALLDVIVQLTPLPVVRGQLLHLFPPVKAVQRHQPIEHPLSQDGISHELIPAQVILKCFLCEVGARHTGRVLGTLEVSNRCIHITHCSDLPLS